MKTSSVLIAAWLLGTTVGTAVFAAEYRDGANGFRLDLPSFGSVDKLGAQVLTVAGPPVNGFSPNCNVQVQSMSGSLEEYEALTLKQFDSLGFTLIESTRVAAGARPSIRWHYSGTLRGVEFEWLAVAIERSDQFLLLTCTALKDAYDEVAETFERTVASFRVE